jgi:Fic-DOC domain mobile mystery protein B
MDTRHPAGATPLDPDETGGLLLSHITTREELNRWEQLNIGEAEEWAFNRNHKDLLSQSFICRLHKKMFSSVWAWAGQFRKSMKNLGVQPWQIALEVNQLCQDTSEWIGSATYEPDEICIRFHHKLVWIHPFANGNGRHARLMADLLSKQIFNNEPFTWGRTDLMGPGKSRSAYIAALQAADEHNFSLLLKFARS